MIQHTKLHIVRRLNSLKSIKPLQFVVYFSKYKDVGHTWDYWFCRRMSCHDHINIAAINSVSADSAEKAEKHVWNPLRDHIFPNQEVIFCDSPWCWPHAAQSLKLSNDLCTGTSDLSKRLKMNHFPSICWTSYLKSSCTYIILPF